MLDLPALQQDIVSSGNQEIRKETKNSLPECDVSDGVRWRLESLVKRHAGEAGAGPHAVLRSWINWAQGHGTASLRPFIHDRAAASTRFIPARIYIRPGKKYHVYRTNKIKNTSCRFPEFLSSRAGIQDHQGCMEHEEVEFESIQICTPKRLDFGSDTISASEHGRPAKGASLPASMNGLRIC